MDEVWKGVEGFEGYEVSNLGRVRSIKILSPCNVSYARVSLLRNKEIFYHRIHRLVLETFVGPAPEGMEACHNDGNRYNNTLENLRWDTRSNNQKDCKKNRANKNGFRRIPKEMFEAIKSDTRSNGAVAKEHGIHPTTVSKIRSGLHSKRFQKL